MPALIWELTISMVKCVTACGYINTEDNNYYSQAKGFSISMTG